jgi:DNA-binding HxlR family transcriptional regulator
VLRSDCPIAASLDLLGDRWTLLVLRDLLLSDRAQFGELVQGESIASNILADRLANLVESGIIERLPHPDDGRKFMYRPLMPAVELLPIIAELVAWGAKYTPVELPAALGPLTDPKARRAIVAARMKELMREVSQAAVGGPESTAPRVRAR